MMIAPKSAPAAKPWNTWNGKRAMMPPKMMIETPWPTPYWVISSPIHTSSIVPAVIEIMIASVPSGSTSKPKFLMIGVLLPELKLIRFGVPKAWNMASGTVSQ